MTSYLEMSDQDLMRLVCMENHDAFASLVSRHTHRFFALAYRSLQNKADAEEVVQSAFFKLWQKPHLWKSDKSQFTTWFYRVVLNACHDYRRKQSKLDREGFEFDQSIALATDCEQSNLERNQELSIQQQYLEMAMSELSVSQRDAINLVVYAELPQKQAAAVMGVSLKALESILIRAKRLLLKHVALLQS
jgi:RNA polymerase sigma-70 factor (ECF subfamily)